MSRALILDFDRSVSALPGATSIDLTDWQDTIRYGCSLADLERLEAFLETRRTSFPPITFLGSGDFHHVSLPLIRRRQEAGRFQVVVFDNHPDNMRYPWGIHCGSWVHHVCALPFVSAVTVVGIASNDVRWNHLWENHLLPLYRGKLTYLCFAPIPRLTRLLALPGFHDLSPERDRFPDALAERILGRSGDPIYLSIDKDVLAANAVATNWDQGEMRESELLEAVRRLRRHVFATDVTGEISFFQYSRYRWWKRALARLDGQSAAPPSDLAKLQASQHALNQRLLEAVTAEG